MRGPLIGGEKRPERDWLGFYTLGGIHFSLFLSGFLFELHVAEVHYASSQLVHAHLLLWSEAQDIEGFLRTQECSEGEDRKEIIISAARDTTAPWTGQSIMYGRIF